MPITQPVGRNAPNQPDDVVLIQALLNLNLMQLPGVGFLAEDGVFGPSTASAIQEYQQSVVTPGSGSGVIEPGSPTLNSLAAAITGDLDTLTLRIIMPLSPAALPNRFLVPLTAAMAAHQIDTPLRRSHFLAQLGHESGSLQYTAELSSGQQYEGRADLGNTQPGDGPRFKGRGLIQVTGRANYTAYGNARGRDVVTGNNAALLASDPNLAADCSAWFWTVHNLNAIADTDNEPGADAAARITQAINGGMNGFADRQRRLKLTKCFLAALLS